MTPLYIPIYLYLPNMVRLATFLIYLGLNLLGPKGKILKVFLTAGYKVGFDNNIFNYHNSDPDGSHCVQSLIMSLVLEAALLQFSRGHLHNKLKPECKVCK